MNRFKISRQASRDLEDIWVYLSQHDGLAADRLLAKILNKFPMLAQFPEMGTIRAELSKELRSFPVKPYIIFYKRMEDCVEIVRILHQSRDIENRV
ncbi:type II toxin-antitoxin system RelE/ParE family toxin [Tumidithrix elongata RA019]|uniref:Toxin n=1 Tax=Tumidithrix elongata BACA0141 TaxID=2716417 RepID=A0AAW9PWZ5_9CYAN|nr:type II toxin-antitoxin system RelE/ParE family toxin [Tumidithrix elongata RA019]